jgi:hypothetical protein
MKSSPDEMSSSMTTNLSIADSRSCTKGTNRLPKGSHHSQSQKHVETETHRQIHMDTHRDRNTNLDIKSKCLSLPFLAEGWVEAVILDRACAIGI